MTPVRRVVFCTYPSVFSQIVLQQLCAADHVEVAGIVASERVLHPRYGLLRGAYRQIRTSGLSYAGYLLAATSLLPVLATGCHVGALARRHHIPVFKTRKINSAPAQRFVEDCEADVLLCANFNQRVGDELLQHPRRVAVNIHPGQLPQYRGVDPVFFGLLDNCAKLSVTTHLMASGFDTGPVLTDTTIKPVDRSLLLSSAALFRAGAGAVVELLQSDPRRYASMATPQQGRPRYDSWPTAAQVRFFRSRGGRLLGGWRQVC